MTQPPPTPHSVLGIPETATITDAEQAWKRLVRALHPDRHAPQDRAALGLRLSEVNAAWSALRNRPFQKAPVAHPQQHAVFYTARDPLISHTLTTLLAKDAKAVHKAWWRALLRGTWPRRARPLSVVLCSAVVVEGRSATLLFEAPLPKGRAAILIPTVQWTGSRLSVQAERPRTITLDVPTGMVGQFSPFSPEEVQATGLENLAVMFPSRPLDITKTVRLQPESGLSRLFYLKSP